MNADQISERMCRLSDVLHFIYLTPMTTAAIGKRLYPEFKPSTYVTIMNRIIKTAEKAGIKVSRQVDYDSNGRIYEYWITDPFWRDKLEAYYGVTARP